MRGVRRSWVERFWEKVDKDGPLGLAVDGTQTPCWIWIGALSRNSPAALGGPNGGYGHFRLDSFRVARAHKVCYTLLVGPVPGGLYLLHSCDRRACVNPGHLRVSTATENLREMWARGRRIREKHPGIRAPLELAL